MNLRGLIKILDVDVSLCSPRMMQERVRPGGGGRRSRRSSWTCCRGRRGPGAARRTAP